MIPDQRLAHRRDELFIRRQRIEGGSQAVRRPLLGIMAPDAIAGLRRGQLMAAGILYWTLERNHGEE